MSGTCDGEDGRAVAYEHADVLQMIRFALLMLLCVLLLAPVGAQEGNGTVRVQVRSADGPVADADVTIGTFTARTGTDGAVTIAAPAGRLELTVTRAGFVTETTAVQVPAEGLVDVVVELTGQPAIEEEVTVVGATRTGKRLEDQAMRVEVLGREEIEEKMLMTPGDIVMMLNEMGGMRVQATSPSLGAASVRIQGMRGRYTRVLSDGLPLFGEVGGLGLLQIPPMDLGQVEVIKGAASSLYGAGAMGGVVNLMARRPSERPEYEFLLNRSTRGGTDAVAYLSAPIGDGWSASVLGGGHWQNTGDVDGDGWLDLAGYSRGVIRPRLFWEREGGGSLFATAGYVYENRRGGTAEGHALGATGRPHRDLLKTHRADAGAVAQFVAGRYLVSLRGAAALQDHDHHFGEVAERDRHATAFGELTARAARGRHMWIAGLAIERDAYDPQDVPRFQYAYTVPGAFAQYDVELPRGAALSASARLDVHSEYGTFFSPRVSAVARRAGWTSRLSAGAGFFAPTPITEETEAAGLTRLQAGPLAAERGRSASFDLSRTDGPVSYTATLFASRVSNPLHVDRATYTLRSLSSPTTNAGAELLATLRQEPYALTATYTYVRARETAEGLRRPVPLTPRHSAGIVAMWEPEGAGRIGVEWYYTGRQALEENPFRQESAPYVIVGVLAEKRVGRLRLFVNGENLTGTRQTRWDPLLRSSRAADGRWTVDAWAPLDGRTVNGGVRVYF